MAYEIAYVIVLFFPQKYYFSKNHFRNTIRVPNGLDSDQDQRTVGPDLIPNCLQRLSTDEKVAASKEKVKI